jgi:hypothetical protein
MTLILASGEAGNGKSTQHVDLCRYSDIEKMPHIYLCMEVKDKKLLDMSGINSVQIIQYDKDFQEEPIETINMLEKTIRQIIHESKYKIVVLDGISDIRRFAQKEWIFKDNLLRSKEGKPPRAMISGENKGAWAAINMRVMGILEPLINWSNIKGTHVFFTAQMKDAYLNDKKVGRQIAAGDWIEFDVDVKARFYINTEGIYMVKFEKTPGWAVQMDADVPVARGGYIGLLAERGLL